MSNDRESKFELMRIISMFFIVWAHAVLHGKVLENANNPVLYNFLELTRYIVLVHVNSYVLLFGYFQSKSNFRLSKLIKLFLQVTFYSIVFFAIAVKLGWLVDYNFVSIVENIIPSCISNYWFINAYIITYIFSDYINIFINRLSRKEYKNLLFIMFIMMSIVPYITGLKVVDNNGYHYIHFIYIYLIGAYLRKYSLKETYHFRRLSLSGYRFLLIVTFLGMGIVNYLVNYYMLNINELSNMSTYLSSTILLCPTKYSAPFLVIQSIAYFEFFKSLKFKSKSINVLSKYVFGVYLFHDNIYVREQIYKIVGIDNGLFYGYRHIIYVFVGSIIIFVVGLIFEYIRQLIFKLFGKIPILIKIKEKLYSFVTSFNSKIRI